MYRLRKGDEVVVTTGSSKGARGKIEKVILNRNRQPEKVVITGVNQRIRHQRGNPQKKDPGGRVQKEFPVHVSNVALYNEHKKGSGRVRIEIGEDKKPYRVFVDGGQRV